MNDTYNTRESKIKKDRDMYVSVKRKSSADDHSGVQKKSGLNQGVTFVDNRFKAIAQRKDKQITLNDMRENDRQGSIGNTTQLRKKIKRRMP